MIFLLGLSAGRVGLNVDPARDTGELEDSQGGELEFPWGDAESSQSHFVHGFFASESNDSSLEGDQSSGRSSITLSGEGGKEGIGS